MKEKECETLAKRYLLPEFPGMRAKGKLVFYEPVNELLKGFCFDRSGFAPRDFSLWTFVQALYDPSETIAFVFGRRSDQFVSRPKFGWWKLDKQPEDKIFAEVVASLKADGLPYFEGITDAASLCANVDRLRRQANDPDPYVLGAVGYGYIWSGDIPKALERLDRLVSLWRKPDETREWMRILLDRVDFMRQTLRENPDSAMDILKSWRDYTVIKLGLEKEAGLLTRP